MLDFIDRHFGEIIIYENSDFAFLLSDVTIDKLLSTSRWEELARVNIVATRDIATRNVVLLKNRNGALDDSYMKGYLSIRKVQNSELI